jgi:hypothetical protein
MKAGVVTARSDHSVQHHHGGVVDAAGHVDAQRLAGCSSTTLSSVNRPPSLVW